ncbi:hypothetical protein BU15DRAFT_73164 [Melanogaster broomeanus]|nr:hypothetical protein BU15DRAFT_73164 [Melanogaster broomeanus]
MTPRTDRSNGKLPIQSNDPPPVYDSQPCNVVIFGETGAGKSSVINLIAQSEVALTSSECNRLHFGIDSLPCRSSTQQAVLRMGYSGLNEAGLVQDDYLNSIEKAYKLIKSLENSGGVHLLLFCMRGGRITDVVEQNYKLFFNILCEKQVPLAVVVTNSENEPCMEEWWHNNERDVQEMWNIHSMVMHASLLPRASTTCTGRDTKSRKRQCRGYYLTYLPNTAWKKEKRIWFVSVLGKMARMLPFRRSNSIRKELIERLVKECKFPQREAEGIATSIEAIRDQAPRPAQKLR